MKQQIANCYYDISMNNGTINRIYVINRDISVRFVLNEIELNEHKFSDPKEAVDFVLFLLKYTIDSAESVENYTGCLIHLRELY